MVDEIVEGLRRGEGHFAGAAVGTLGHAAALTGEVEGTAGTVLYAKAKGNRLFQLGKNRFCLAVQLTQILQRTQNAVHIHVRHCGCFYQGLYLRVILKVACSELQQAT